MFNLVYGGGRTIDNEYTIIAIVEYYVVLVLSDTTTTTSKTNCQL